MRTLNELLSELKRLGRDIRNVQQACGYDDCDDLSRLDIPMSDPNALFLRDELRGVMEKLADAQAGIEYLNSPVKEEGVLRKGGNGRYRLNGRELPCGSVIEILADDDRHAQDIDGDYRNVPYWLSGRLEHDEDYYFTGAKAMPLNGAKARIR